MRNARASNMSRPRGCAAPGFLTARTRSSRSDTPFQIVHYKLKLLISCRADDGRYALSDISPQRTRSEAWGLFPAVGLAAKGLTPVEQRFSDILSRNGLVEAVTSKAPRVRVPQTYALRTGAHRLHKRFPFSDTFLQSLSKAQEHRRTAAMGLQVSPPTLMPRFGTTS